ncbi:MAG: 3-hydroxyacyl-ACP dehydratase FabZ [Moraxellaceae bacterium]|nr:3-hydroxyacyl-ACP dehydratase FabZ [Moraxellaceae bacterium]
MTENDIKFLAEQGIELPMNTRQLQRYLPHRYPFVLVDRVTEIIAHKHIIGYKNVSNNEEFFNGHFPNQPVMPAVLIIEAMAQLAGILGFVSDKLDLSDGSMYLFAGVDKARFKSPVIPADKLILQAEEIAVRKNIYKYKCQALVEDKIASSAEIMLIKQEIK